MHCSLSIRLICCLSHMVLGMVKLSPREALRLEVSMQNWSKYNQSLPFKDLNPPIQGSRPESPVLEWYGGAYESSITELDASHLHQITRTEKVIWINCSWETLMSQVKIHHEIHLHIFCHSPLYVTYPQTENKLPIFCVGISKPVEKYKF